MSAAKTATKVKILRNYRGDAALYRLSEPYEGVDLVIVSAANVPYSGPETYIFPAEDEKGTTSSWAEMPGSFRGGMSHAEALANAGYEVAK